MSVAEFKHYLQQQPTAVCDKRQLLSILKDTIRSDRKKYQVLYQTYEAGIIDVLKASNPPPKDECLRIELALKQQYGLADQAAKFAVNFWVEAFEDFSFETLASTESSPSFMSLPESDENTFQGPQLISITWNPLRKEVSVQWKRQQDIESYEVWRSVGAQQAKLIKHDIFPLPRFSDTEIVPGELHTYVVRSTPPNSEVASSFSNILQIAIPANKNSFEISEFRILADAVQLRWNYQTRAAQYLIKRKKPAKNKWETVCTAPNTQFTYLDKKTPDKTQYTYQMECQRRNHSALISHEVTVTV